MIKIFLCVHKRCLSAEKERIGVGAEGAIGLAQRHRVGRFAGQDAIAVAIDPDLSLIHI